MLYLAGNELCVSYGNIDKPITMSLYILMYTSIWHLYMYNIIWRNSELYIRLWDILDCVLSGSYGSH